ncbi:MAG: hypothetical protein AAF226_18605, partial [Verrucomicrobiota bacterium]
KVMEGDSWKKVLNERVPHFGAIRSEASYTFSKYDQVDGKQCAIIDFFTDIQLVEAEAGGLLDMIGMSLGKGRIEGQFSYDPEQRVIRSSSIKVSIPTTIKLHEDAKPFTAQTVTTWTSRLLSIRDIEDG